jgi:glycosyltransferase involved in cell wall biosynthesis
MDTQPHDAPQPNDPDRVAVVIPVYNGQAHLAECLESVLAQGPIVHEVIVADDGSTDATPTIIDTFAARDARFTGIRMPNSGGPAAPRNRGAAASSCEWIAFVDSDDVWAPGKLVTQMGALRADPGLVAVGGIARYLGTRGPMSGIFGAPPSTETWDEVAAGRTMPFQVASTVVVRRSAFEAIGGFDESLPASEDLDFIARLCATGRIGCVTDEVAYYRLRRDSLIGANYRTLILMPRFIAARIAARRNGSDLSIEQFDAFDRITIGERRTVIGGRAFRNTAVDIAERRWGRLSLDATCAVGLTPLRTVRRLREKVRVRPRH